MPVPFLLKIFVKIITHTVSRNASDALLLVALNDIRKGIFVPRHYGKVHNGASGAGE